MKVEFWIKLAARESRYGLGWEPFGTPKTSKTKPDVGRHEIAVKILFDVPESYFAEPQIVIKADLPEREGEPLISTEIKNGIAEAVATQLGVKVHISASDEVPEMKG